jgi:hypothetical protein
MTDAATDTLYCANHPNVATALRCNKCNKPICARCAVRTPVGYRCPECVRTQQQVFETAAWYDYAIGAVVGGVLGVVATLGLGVLGWFMIFLAPVAGGISAEVVRAAVRRRRGRYLPAAAAGAYALGCLVVIGAPLVAGLAFGVPLRGAGSLLLGLLVPGIYTVLATSTLYMRLRGIAL